MAAALSKLEAYAARLALIHHVVGRAAGGESDLVPVSRNSVEAGVRLCRWFAQEARRIYAALSESDEDRDARRLLERVRSRESQTMTVRDVQRWNSRKYPRAEEAEAAMEALVRAGWGFWVEVSQGRQGGLPTRAIKLNDSHDTEDGDGGPDGDVILPSEEIGGGGESHSASTALNPTRPEIPATGPAAEPGGGVGTVVRLAPSDGPSHEGQCDGDGDGGGPLVEDGSAVPAEQAARGNQRASGPDEPQYQLVRDQAGLDAALAMISDAPMIGLDLETTGLCGRTDRVRLLSLAWEDPAGEQRCLLMDCFAVDPRPVMGLLAKRELVIHNAAFDLAFLARLGFTPGTVHDTMLLAQLLTSGHKGVVVKLAACCERYLRQGLDKTEQLSDWSGDLTPNQLRYAARDVAVLVPLFRALSQEIEEKQLSQVAEIERRCLPALVWLASRGVQIDRDAWSTLARSAADEVRRLATELDAQAPPRSKCKGQNEPWNWNSPAQVKKALARAGCKLKDTTDETLAETGHPLAALVRNHRQAKKRCSSYGEKWLGRVAADGRVYASWRQIGAASGRMSCAEPNLQQLPQGAHRRCVVAPPGRVLVKADYSQIEVRIAAKLTGDENLLRAFREGADIHALTARAVLAVQDVSKEQRHLAKALNFGLLYGMGAEAFQRYARAQYGLRLTEAEAGRYREVFFKAYPGLAQWHRSLKNVMSDYTAKTFTGRRRQLGLNEIYTQRLNSPVQGTGADGLKLALALLWERRQEVPGAFPVLAVHDELVVECDAGQAKAVAAWLEQAMLDAMTPLLEPVPVEVKVAVARTWGGD